MLGQAACGVSARWNRTGLSLTTSSAARGMATDVPPTNRADWAELLVRHHHFGPEKIAMYLKRR